MIELIVKKYIENNLDIKVFFEFPKEKIKEFVLIDYIGSSSSNQLNSTRLAIQSYSDSLFKAASLNNRIKKILNNIIELNEISKIELDTDYNYSDKELKKYRYQAIFDIFHY